MFAERESLVEKIQAVPVSPTLLAQQRYVSVLAKVPEELASYILGWRRAQPEIQEAGSVHITVLVAHEEGSPTAAFESLRRLLAGSGSFTVRLGAPASFAPVTAVSYLPVQEGTSKLQGLNMLAEQALGASASPFDYHPHVTLAQHVSDDVLARSLLDFEDIPEYLATFEVSCVRVYLYDGFTWGAIGSITL